MRVFVTGATGFIGTAIVQELINAGHQVLGLARSEESAQALIAAGAEVHRGTLDDLESLKSGAAASDGVIHAGFNHDFSNYAGACETDRKAITAMGEVLAGTDRPLIITSGIGLLKPGAVGTENDNPDPHAAGSPRAPSEGITLAFAERGVRAAIIRLPPSVYGDGDYGFIPALIGIAREKGIAAYVGSGENHWPAVHRLDAAKLFRLALEKGKAGAKYHAIGDQGIPMKEIAGLMAKKLDIPAESITPEAAGQHFGWIAHFSAMDVPASAALTQEELGWKPVQPGLLDDLEHGTYFMN